MKMTAASSVLGVGMLTLGSGTRVKNIRLTLEGVRARPGTPLSLTMELLDEKLHSDIFGVKRLRARLVALDEEGLAKYIFSTVELLATSPSRWETTVRVPNGHDPLTESYKLSVAFVDIQGRLAMSAPVEIICTPFHAGF